ncbi:O-antigen ligase family protein [Variovorax sp. HJSM1_2]|uniref:O-antigen ligase family protein n=1 Tax=Variovorax sp. HJSM1_2 TaxID=3366263 RepID=UPI003BC2F99E
MSFLKIERLVLAQSLMIAALLSLLASPPLTNLFEALTFLVIVFTPALRTRVLRFFSTPAGWWVLAFMLALGSALLYGIAPRSVILSDLHSWRRILLLPMAASLFADSPLAKRRAAYSLFCAAAVFVAYSFVAYALPNLFYWVEDRGVVVRNHSTQGLFFAVAVLVGITALYHRWFRSNAEKYFYAGFSILLFANITLFTPGRSGYFALLVLFGVYFSRKMMREPSAKNLSIAALSVALVAGVLYFSPLANKKLTQAVEEAQLYNVNASKNVVTSVGVRVMYWRTTLQMIPKHPILGVGTGAFALAYANEVAGRTDLTGFVTPDPHNQFMKIAAEQGLLGLAIFIGLLIAVARQRTSEPFTYLGLCVLLTWCVTSMGNAHFTTFSEGHFIWMWLGMMFAAEKTASEVPPSMA